MTELQVYAPGLRDPNKLMHLSHQMDVLPMRFKIDAPHDMVYFEIDDATKVNLRQIHHLFTNIGLEPRFVGQIPPELQNGEITQRLMP